jgi:hypothetical protein
LAFPGFHPLLDELADSSATLGGADFKFQVQILADIGGKADDGRSNTRIVACCPKG